MKRHHYPVFSGNLERVGVAIPAMLGRRMRHKKRLCGLVVAGFGMAGALVMVEVALVDEAEAGEGEQFVDLLDVF